jgi:DNA-binding response OmpR family regulator
VALITGNPGELKDQLTAEEAALFDRFEKPVDMSNLADRLRALFPRNLRKRRSPPRRHETFSSSAR